MKEMELKVKIEMYDVSLIFFFFCVSINICGRDSFEGL